MLFITASNTASDSTDAATDMPSRRLISRALRISACSTGQIHVVVRSPQQNRLDPARRLPVAIHPALAPLKPVRVPRQVVAPHGVKMLLQVDALAEAVGRHQYAPLVAHYVVNDLFALLIVPVAAGNRPDFNIRMRSRQHIAQLLRHILGGGDKAAVDNRAIAALDHIKRGVVALGELGVLLDAAQFAGAAEEPVQPAQFLAGERGVRGGERGGGRVIGRRVRFGVGVQRLRDELMDARMLFALRFGKPIRSGAERSLGGGRAGQDAAQYGHRRPISYALPLAAAAGR